MSKFIQTLIFFILFSLFNPINSTNPTNPRNSVNWYAWAQNSKKQQGIGSIDIPENYVIGKGDVLRVFVWRSEQLSGQVTVRPDGKISLPLIQDLSVEGLTVVELKDQITGRLKQYVQNPTVTVIVDQIKSYKVSVLGRVTTPGVYPITGDTTLVEAISMAGGFNQWAKRRKITVIRSEGGKKKKLRINYKKIVSGKDPSQNIILKRGDTIIVP
ncbi:MAG: polysaccharide biosynthesis/export family protein [Candidatus Hodarchaeota archaeon]